MCKWHKLLIEQEESQVVVLTVLPNLRYIVLDELSNLYEQCFPRILLTQNKKTTYKRVIKAEPDNSPKDKHPLN